MYHVILYYNFTRIENLPKFRAAHRRKCKKFDLLGRVYISEEGINGTLAGAPENIKAYKDYLWELPGFDNTEFKDDVAAEMPFVKLIVRAREELATLKSPIPIDATQEKENHMSPEEWKRTLDSNEDYVLIDVRNNYETDIGYFEGAIKPDLKNFYDFPEWIDESGIEKDKKVLMYCTGGIRCEKFSVLMKKKGYTDIHQLHGGIINYANTVGDAHYKGKCFVFDDRLAVPVEKDQKEPLTKCEITGDPCDTYLNCANPDCNRLFICSEKGAHKYEGCCSADCMKSKRRRPFDPDNIYGPTRKWYTYFESKEEYSNLPKVKPELERVE